MSMKTVHVKNTEQIVTKGQMRRLTGGVGQWGKLPKVDKLGNLPGWQSGQKVAWRGIAP